MTAMWTGRDNDLSVAFRYEHSPSGTLLLCGAAWRHNGSGAEYSVRNTTTGGERTGGAVGGGPGDHIVSAAAIRSDAAGRETVRIYSAVFFEPGCGVAGAAKRQDATDSRRSFNDGAAGS